MMTFNDISLESGYMGNQNIKKPGVSIPWSEEMVKEYVKCSKDPIYFIRNYVKIVNADAGLVPFELYDYQEKMIVSMVENRNTVITTARQVGKSTTTVAYILWYIIFNEDKTVALLANKGDTAREILGRIRLAYEHLPKWLQHGVKEWNKGSLELENNSRIIAGTTSSSAIRGYTINLLFIDEAAHIDNWEEFFTSVYPTISSGKTTKIILVSTPNGLNHFYKLWINAKEGRNSYNPIIVYWNEVPGRDELWKQDTLAGMNYDFQKFSQEYECEFLGSSGTLISGAKLKQLVHKTPIVEKHNISMYFEPKKDHRYVLVADTSRGKGLDYSAFQIIDVTKMPYEQVCVFRDNMTVPIDYASIIHRLATQYNEATVLAEVNDLGEQVATSLFEDFEYENMLFTENRGRSGKMIVPGFSGKGDKGVNTSKSVKATGCSILKLLIEQDQLLIHDYNTIEELSTFSKKGHGWEAEPGCHDDLVICLVLFAWLSNQKFFKEYTDINTLYNLRETSEEQMMEQLVPFGIIDTGESSFEEKSVIDLTSVEDRWLMEDI